MNKFAKAGKERPLISEEESDDSKTFEQDDPGNASQDEGAVLNFCRKFLSHNKLVVVLFIVLAILCGTMIPRVSVNYSLSDYLPEDEPSTQAIDAMEDSFGSGVPNARLFVEGLDLSQASELADALAALPGTDEVTWLGTVVDTKLPLAVANQESVDSWKDGDDGYLFQLVIDEDDSDAAITDIRNAAAQAGATQISMDGSQVSLNTMQQDASVQIVYIMLIAILIIVLILLFTSHSWFEPVIFLTAVGVAILMNMGTNIILGEISFVSQICGAVLQLAVSMDYAIVMLHTFRRCKREYPDDREAMAHAMKRGFSVVCSSAAVTFFAFLSLTVMHFGIGVNMGIVLSKGIAFSFLSVMFFMPCFMLLCQRPLDASEHRSLIPSLDKLARGCQKIMVPAAVVIILVAIPAFLAQSQTDFLYGSSKLTDPESQAGIEEARIQEAFGEEETWVLMVPEGNWAEEQRVLDEIRDLDGVTGVTSYLTVAGRGMPVEAIPSSQLDQVISNGWSRMIITSNRGAEGDEVFSLVEQVREAASSEYGDEWLLAGNAVSTYDLRNVVQEDSTRVKIFSLATIALVLALMFRSLTIPIVMLIAIEVSIWMNLAVPYFLGENLNYIGYLVIDAVQLGAAVDYAIIYAREYFDRRRLYDPREAARSAVKHGGISILTSSSILAFAGIAIWLISTNGIISELGGLIARGAFLAMLMMFLFLPWLFRTFDGIICRTSIGLKFDHKKKQETAG